MSLVTLLVELDALVLPILLCTVHVHDMENGSIRNRGCQPFAFCLEMVCSKQPCKLVSFETVEVQGREIWHFRDSTDYSFILERGS